MHVWLALAAASSTAALIAYLMSKLFGRIEDDLTSLSSSQNNSYSLNSQPSLKESTNELLSSLLEPGYDIEQERKIKQAQEAIQKTNQGNQILVEFLLSQSNLSPSILRMIDSDDRDQIKSLLRRIDLEQLQIISCASGVNDIEFDLKQNIILDPVNYPTKKVEPENFHNYDQLSQMLPLGYLMEDDEFAYNIATNQIPVLQSYESITKKKLLYILLDVSGSMDSHMSDGIVKSIWARGVTIKLLHDALQGYSKYFLRYFDTKCTNMVKATTEEEAQSVINSLYLQDFDGGGTNIIQAIKVAKKDIQNNQDNVSRSEILLISDGEDSGLTEDSITKVLKGSPNLHSIMIGAESSLLKAHSKTYKSYY